MGPDDVLVTGVSCPEWGGVALVQSPSQAEFSVMPVRAIKNDNVDGVLPVEELAEALTALAAGEAFDDGRSRQAVA